MNSPFDVLVDSDDECLALIIESEDGPHHAEMDDADNNMGDEAFVRIDAYM
jgi:hypothetical protein